MWHHAGSRWLYAPDSMERWLRAAPYLEFWSDGSWKEGNLHHIGYCVSPLTEPQQFRNSANQFRFIDFLCVLFPPLRCGKCLDGNGNRTSSSRFNASWTVVTKHKNKLSVDTRIQNQSKEETSCNAKEIGRNEFFLHSLTFASFRLLEIHWHELCDWTWSSCLLGSFCFPGTLEFRTFRTYLVTGKTRFRCLRVVELFTMGVVLGEPTES